MLKKERKMNGLVYSADDFGAGDIVNPRLLRLAEKGILNRVAVMPHGKISPDEAKFLLGTGVFLDVHLDMQDEINPERKLKEGAAKRIFLFLKEYFYGKISPRKIELLWEKQIEDFRRIFGRLPDGINSHQHIHFFPPYFKIALRLAEKYDISFIRLGQRSFGKLKPIPFILDILRKIDKKYLGSSTVQTSSLMISADWIQNFDFEKYEKFSSPENQTEIIFHPEREDEFNFLENT